MKLLLINHSSKPMPREFLKTWTRAVLREFSRLGLRNQWRGQELVVVLVDEAEGRRLNHQFRGKDRATDVLSFAAPGGQGLGELVLCAPVVAQQAKEHGLSFRCELAYLVLHGLLHLLGYEHEQGGARAKEMYSIQDQVFARLERLC